MSRHNSQFSKTIGGQIMIWGQIQGEDTIILDEKCELFMRES